MTRAKSAPMIHIKSTRRRLYRLWRKQRELDARIEEAVRRRFQQFRRGSISSDEFEKPTREERKFARLRKLIVKVEEKTKPKRQYTKRVTRDRVSYSVVQAT